MRTLTMRRGLRASVLAGALGSLAAATLAHCVFTIAPLSDSMPDATTHPDGISSGHDATDDRVIDASLDGRDASSAQDATVRDSPETECDEASVSTDPANCGACHHGCLEGGCLGGKCLPVTLFSMLGANPSGIYVSDDVVFCTLFLPSPKGAVLEVQPSNDVLQTGLAEATMITGEGTTLLYWTVGGTGPPSNDEAGIGSLANGTTHFLSLSGPAYHPRAIVVLNGGDIAFANIVDGGNVMRVSGFLAGTPKPLTTILGNYYGLATDGTHVWTTSTTDHTLYRLDPGDGGGPTTQHVVFTDPDAGPTYVVYRDGRVFLSNYEASYIGVIDQPTLDDQALRPLVTAETSFAPSPLEPDAGRAISAVFAIAADDRYVYWTDKNGGSVGRVAYGDGGPAEVVAYLPETGPNQLYVTDAAVYFTAVINGSVYRLAK